MPDKESRPIPTTQCVSIPPKMWVIESRPGPRLFRLGNARPVRRRRRSRDRRRVSASSRAAGVEVARGMRVDAGEHVDQPGLWVDVVQPRRLDQGVITAAPRRPGPSRRTALLSGRALTPRPEPLGRAEAVDLPLDREDRIDAPDRLRRNTRSSRTPRSGFVHPVDETQGQGRRHHLAISGWFCWMETGGVNT